MSEPNSVVDVLSRTGSFVETPKGRGQPPLTSQTIARIYRSLAVRVALQVRVETHRLGSKRGSKERAIDAVAVLYSKRIGNRPYIPRSTVKKYEQRYGKHVEQRAKAIVEIDRVTREIERRTLGFPEDVRETLFMRCSSVPLLRYLRDAGIDGTCPKSLIDEVRRLQAP